MATCCDVTDVLTRSYVWRRLSAPPSSVALEDPRSAFTTRELYDYVLGKLDIERAQQVENELKIDAELKGKVAFFASLLGKTLHEEETGN